MSPGGSEPIVSSFWRVAMGTIFFIPVYAGLVTFARETVYLAGP
jgi:hypothetical protein